MVVTSFITFRLLETLHIPHREALSSFIAKAKSSSSFQNSFSAGQLQQHLCGVRAPAAPAVLAPVSTTIACAIVLVLVLAAGVSSGARCVLAPVLVLVLAALPSFPISASSRFRNLASPTSPAANFKH